MPYPFTPSFPYCFILIPYPFLIPIPSHSHTASFSFPYPLLTARLCGVNLEMVDCMTRSASKVAEKGSSVEASIVCLIPSNIPGSSDTCAKDSCIRKN